MRNNKTVDISVIVPVFNVDKWISRCIKSILIQNFTNFELILVNDGSTDDSLEICKFFQKQDPRVNIIDKKNGGLSDARNYGIASAKGKYLVFVDGDDYVQPTYLNELLKGIKETNADVAMCEYNLVDEKGNFIKLEKFNEPETVTSFSGRDLLKYKYKPFGAPNIVAWNKIYKKELFEKIRYDKGRYYEDEYILVPLFWNIEKVCLIRKPLYNYVQRNNSIMSSPLTLKKIRDKNDINLERIAFFKNKNDDLLYELAIKEYKNRIIDFDKEEIIKSDKHLKKYYQKQYRMLVMLTFKSQTVNTFDLKQMIKDTICFCNINFYNTILQLFNK